MKLFFIFFILFIILIPVNVARATTINLTNSSYVAACYPDENYESHTWEYVGYSCDEEQMFYEIPTIPKKYYGLTTNSTNPAIYSEFYGTTNVRNKPFYDDNNNTLNLNCDFQCEGNYITVKLTTIFDKTTLTWDLRPAFTENISSKYMVFGWNAFNLTPTPPTPTPTPSPTAPHIIPTSIEPQVQRARWLEYSYITILLMFFLLASAIAQKR